MTALLESFSLMVTLDVIFLLIPTILLFSQVRKPILDNGPGTWHWALRCGSIAKGSPILHVGRELIQCEKVQKLQCGAESHVICIAATTPSPSLISLIAPSHTRFSQMERTLRTLPHFLIHLFYLWCVCLNKRTCIVMYILATPPNSFEMVKCII